MSALDRGGRPPATPLPAEIVTDAGHRFQVRAYRPDDRATLVDFYGAFEPKRGAQGLPPLGEHRIRRWLDEVLRDGVHLVIERDERLVGHAFLVPTTRTGQVEYAIFLDRAERDRGLGTRVNELAIEAARHAGYARVWLSVEPHNRAALRSYLKAGFQFRRATLLSSEMEMELDLTAPPAA